jgi:membrane-bound transcription factor site-1 protease
LDAGSQQAQAGSKLTEIFKSAEKYHRAGQKGNGIKIAIFDSGLSEAYQGKEESPLKAKKIINFTHDPSAKDTLGHGTFISGVVGSTNPDCPGLAPEAEVYVLKLFTEDRVSYTSWFLDAFNFVL